MGKRGSGMIYLLIVWKSGFTYYQNGVWCLRYPIFFGRRQGWRIAVGKLRCIYLNTQVCRIGRSNLEEVENLEWVSNNFRHDKKLQSQRDKIVDSLITRMKLVP